MRKRDVRYEFIRIFSMILVITAHALAAMFPQYAETSLAGLMLSRLVCMSNGLFFMISGKFALQVCCTTSNDYKTYYLKRFGSLGIPVLVCMLLRSMFNVGGWYPDHFLSAAFRAEHIQNVFSGFATSEYWFLYKLVGFLAIAPFVGKMLRQATKAELLWFLGLGMFWNALNTYLPAVGISFSWEYPLGGCFVLFAMGYAIEKIAETQKEENLLLLLGCISFAVSILLERIGWGAGVNDLAPTFAISVAALYVLLKRVYRPGGKLDTVVIKLGGLTMSVYLLHMIVLYTCTHYIPQWPLHLQIVTLILMTLVVTLALSYLLEKTVFAGLKWLYWKATRLR